MNSHHIYSNITKFSSPIGDFIITCNETRIPFNVGRITDHSYLLYNEDGKEYGELKNDDIYEIIIPVENLVLGKDCEIIFTGKNLSDTTSGERTYGKMAVIDNYVIGIGTYDPNEDIKIDQDYEYSKERRYLDQGFIISKEDYVRENFIWYDLKEDAYINGFKFELLDNSSEYIYFKVAWLENIHPLTEDAIDYWIT